MTSWQVPNIEALEIRALQKFSMMPRPFLKWAGSKRAHGIHLVRGLPNKFRRYWEPFLGSGSLFFLLQPTDAVLSDINRELIEVFMAVRDNPRRILGYLETMRAEKAYYYSVRDGQSNGRYRRAADFIFLNRTCWNGLYRVNSEGRFNVPYGKPGRNWRIDARNLVSCSKELRRSTVVLQSGDFEDALVGVGKGDLVYLDPPYVTRHNNNGFVDYNEKLFSWSDQKRLARVANHLVARGAHVIVSNAAHEDLVRLYPTFRSYEFTRSSTLASNPKKRGRVTEAVLIGSRSESKVSKA